MKNNKGWTKLLKCAPIACFYKKNDKSNDKNNINNNRYDVL